MTALVRAAPWIVALALTRAPAAWARGGAPGGAAPSGSAAGLSLADVVRGLKSGDDAKVRAALDDVRVAGRSGSAAVPVIVDLLRTGLSPALTEAALETLGDTESAAGSEIATWYTKHRDVAIRRAAVEALAKTRGSAAQGALRAALSDSDGQVRGLAAAALGDMKARDAVPDLFAALDRNVAEAAASIGELCAGPDCERLAAKLGALPFDVVTSGLDELLLRPAAEVNDELKLGVVQRVRDLGTAEAHHFLKGIQAKWPKKASRGVKQAIDRAVLATAASPGSDGSEVAP